MVEEQGLTASERFLNGIAEKSFLNLWCYPNLYTNKQQNGKGDGKELCDLLVVCGKTILIFSDKSIEFQEEKATELAWGRWYKRAVLKSRDQIVGAMRWLTQYPDRIFIDKQCTQPLPIKLPEISTAQMHGVVVASGAANACCKYFGEKRGSLMIGPPVADALAFTVGDINIDGAYIHVLDESNIKIILQELDTISDFTDYLSKKERFHRSGYLISAASEEDLLAYYLTHTESSGIHDFTDPEHNLLEGKTRLIIDSSVYDEFVASEQYKAKRQADAVSYLWDNLIETFAKHMIDGTTVNYQDQPLDLSYHELGVRHMALQSRLERRAIGMQLDDLMRRSMAADRLTRFFSAGGNSKRMKTGFFFMTLKSREVDHETTYEDYRARRRAMLECYALTFLKKFTHLKRVIGIASEPISPDGSAVNSSEDLILMNRPPWNKKLLNSLAKQQKLYNIDNKKNTRTYRDTTFEYPR